MGNKSGTMAIIAVQNPEGIGEFAQNLHNLGYRICVPEELVEEISPFHVPIDIVPYDNLPGKYLALRDLYGLVCVDLSQLSLPKKVEYRDMVCEDIIRATDATATILAIAAALDGKVVVCEPKQRQAVIDWLENGEPDREAVISLLTTAALCTVGNYLKQSGLYLYDKFIDIAPRSSPYSSWIIGHARKIKDASSLHL